ncbi:DUF4416 family protein [Fibrobacter sp. UBA4309]|uniref:DUF4416 family protein n=1 Tax=Fibrobacter sp. UBA4309 TaxID=1946537 RepID=UPI0025B7E1D0|nr:DUF4416 family protein [Fibrobacter sp. UBA4309]
MGEIRTPAKVKIIVGVLAKDSQSVEDVRETLRNRFGEEDLNLSPFPFTFTNYYVDEIGDVPVRAFFSYETLVERTEIVDIKLWTNDIELEIAEKNGTPGLRPVNLDPGYMTLGQFFLATTKDQRQRVYMQRGIFVEPTLYFQDGHFHAFEWTYRDYQSEKYIQYLEQVRARLAYQMSTGKPYRLRREKEVTSSKLLVTSNY